MGPLWVTVQFSHSVVSDSLQPHESQYARPPCPSPTPGAHSDSRPSSQWCHPAISSSLVPFSSCPQSALESFPVSQLFASGVQSTGVSQGGAKKSEPVALPIPNLQGPTVWKPPASGILSRSPWLGCAGRGLRINPWVPTGAGKVMGGFHWEWILTFFLIEILTSHICYIEHITLYCFRCTT